MIDVDGPIKITLPLGQLASERRDKSIYDEKMMTQAEYRYDGGKNGASWKSKVERYFITKVPVALELLKWAEAHNLDTISEAKFVQAAHPNLTEEQCQVFNREIWGFLSGCLSGQAEVHFKRANMLNGLDAWRRVIRVIEDTLPMKFDQLRRAVQMIHVKPIKDLEGIPNGIAEFETTLEEYEAAGGEATSDRIRKSDLLAILPARIQSDLLWNSVNPATSYQGFRDHVLTQASRILDLDRRTRRGGVNAIAHSQNQEDNAQMPALGSSAAEDQREDDEDAGRNPISSLEELLAMVNKQRANAGGRTQRWRPQAQAPTANGAGKRPPRKCANCGLEHEARICPHPAVAREDRKCWTCGKSGHASRDCPDKKARTPAIKAIEDQLPFFGAHMVAEQSDGFKVATRRAARPVPRGATLQDFIPTPTQNRFGCMTTHDSRPPQRRSQPSLDKTIRSQPTESAVLPIRSQPTESAVLRTSTILAVKPNHNYKAEESKPKKSIVEVQENSRSVAASDSTLMKDAHPKPARGLKSSPNVGLVRAERASAAFRNNVTPLGEGNVSRVGELARTGGAWQRRQLMSEQECVDDLEKAVMAAIHEHSKQGDGNKMQILGELPVAQETFDAINLIYDDDDDDDDNDDQAVMATDVKPKKTKVSVAADSGATDNVINPDDLPEGVELEGPIGTPFENASGGAIQKYGRCVTLMENDDTKVGCSWTACAVTRPLQSVSKTCGPEDGPGLQDMMFNNKIGCVMPPGLLNLILKHVKPVASYPRRGGLYVGDFEISSFRRQGPAR